MCAVHQTYNRAIKPKNSLARAPGEMGRLKASPGEKRAASTSMSCHVTHAYIYTLGVKDYKKNGL